MVFGFGFCPSLFGLTKLFRMIVVAVANRDRETNQYKLALMNVLITIYKNPHFVLRASLPYNLNCSYLKMYQSYHLYVQNIS